MSVNLALVGGPAPHAAGRSTGRDNDDGRAFGDALADAGREKTPAAGRKDATRSSRDIGTESGTTTGATRVKDNEGTADGFALDASQQEGDVDPAAIDAEEADTVGLDGDPAAGEGEADPSPADPAAGPSLARNDAAQQMLAMLKAFIDAPNAAESGSPEEAARGSQSATAATAGPASWTPGLSTTMSALRMPILAAMPMGGGGAQAPHQVGGRFGTAAAGSGRQMAWDGRGEQNGVAQLRGSAGNAGTIQAQAAMQSAAPQDGTRPAYQSIATALADGKQAPGRQAGATLTGQGQLPGTNAGVPGTSPATSAGQPGESLGATASDATAGVEGERTVDAAVRKPGSNARMIDGRSVRGADDALAAIRAPDAAGGRVNVVGFSSALAPAATQAALGSTSAGVVAAMEADPGWRAAAAEAALPPTQRVQAPMGVNTLRIQLNPAELGMVTARLTATGSQLSIEIQAESSDARQRLASDSDAIVKALRAVGYDVDRVTIQQAPASSQGSSAQGGASGRDQSFADQQARGETEARGQGGREGDNRKGEGGRHGPVETAAQRAGGGVYI